MKIKLTDNLKAILIVIGICIAFYIFIFTAWNLTGGDNRKPSSFFWDNTRDGYKPDPLYDRKNKE